MNRQEHLQWCKDRANACISGNDLNSAFTSFNIDMSKHEETKDHLALELGMRLMFNGNLSTNNQMTEWINGFN